MDNSAGIGSLLQFIPAFMSLMHGINNNPQKQTAAQLANVNNAMVNPNNPLYQQMYGQYKQQGQQQLGENISQIEGQNRMLAGMGRTPLFAPERQGEQAFRAQVAAGPQIGIEAGQQTQQALSNAAKGLTMAGGSGGVNEQLLKSQYGPQVNFGANNQVAAGLYGLGGLLNSGQKPQQQPSSNARTYNMAPDIAQYLSSNRNYGLNAPGANQNAWGSY